MSSWTPERRMPFVVSGDAYDRGHAQATGSRGLSEQVRAATVGRVAQARQDGLIDAEAQSFLKRQWAFAEGTDPASLAELAGIADGFEITRDDLFCHLHLGILRDLKTARLSFGDGCSAWAVSHGPDGPLVVKNRDFHGTHLGVQRVFLHEAPAFRAGSVLCVGSLGSPGAYSSGINAHGLALVDTQVDTSDHGVGWLRYFLMSRILSDCRTVEEALAFIRSCTHAGGGNLVLADPSGAVAAVELGHSRLAVELGPLVWRTNHFVSPELEGATIAATSDRIAGNSHARFDLLSSVLPEATWSVHAATQLMSSHGDASRRGSLCQHADAEQSSTISSAVFTCRDCGLFFAEGNPCTSAWHHYQMGD